MQVELEKALIVSGAQLLAIVPEFGEQITLGKPAEKKEDKKKNESKSSQK